MAILLYDCLLIKNIYRLKNRILFSSVRQEHGRLEISMFLIYFTKRTKLLELFIHASTLLKKLTPKQEQKSIVNLTEDRKF